jgi:hypothetical protein
MEEFTYEEMLEEIAKSMSRPVLDKKAGEFTVKDLAMATGIARTTLDYKLSNGVRDGVYTRRKVFSDGHWTWAYKSMEERPILLR